MMTDLTAKFNPSLFEVYGLADAYLTPSQLESVEQVQNRVNGQLDWLAQLLGWNGPEYWSNLVSNINDKRQLLTGTFGVYNSFIVPEVLEIRNWDNTVVIKEDERIQPGQNFYLGDEVYTLQKLEKNDDKFILDFGTLSNTFYSNIANNLQLKADVQASRPEPFVKLSPRSSADISIKVTIDEVNNTLSLAYGSGLGIILPVLNHSFFEKSRPYFDAPLSLKILKGGGNDATVDPVYDFSKGLWYLSVPEVSGVFQAFLEYRSASLPVSLVKWGFDGGWNDINILENYRGVWSHKGGILPYNFTFDSLGIHGLNPEKAVSLEDFETSLSFNKLLNLVYYQRADVSTTPPPPNTNQVWWNDGTGELAVYCGQCFNCGPWVEVSYPKPPNNFNYPIGYLFPDVESFREYDQPFTKDTIVKILDGSSLSTEDSVEGLLGTIAGQCEISLIQRGNQNYWSVESISFQTVTDFTNNALILPGKVPVHIQDSSGLAPNFDGAIVKNLAETLTEPYPIIITKDPEQGVNEWFISPPQGLKYIGDTLLFEPDFVNGELYWDYNEPDPNSRGAAIFYYNRWEKEGLSWVLKGDWVSINSQPLLSEPDAVVNYGVLKIYCDGNLMTEGETLLTSDYQALYLFEEGVLKFKYSPINFKGSTNLPKVTISDSITSTYTYDISEMIFSGVNYRLNPNPLDRNTPLRIWKSEPLVVADNDYPTKVGLLPNLLVADDNSGPADDNWERYFIRLSPLYEREGAEWQKVNLICQDFGLWGSPLYYEDMNGPQQDEKVAIYEEIILTKDKVASRQTVYSEPYLFSGVKFEAGTTEDYENSAILPTLDYKGDGFTEGGLIDYDPLHNRQIVSDKESVNYGNWVGLYGRLEPCEQLAGYLLKDLELGNIIEQVPPIWDLSIYKAPPLNNTGNLSAKVDANHYKVGYAFFTADLSAAEEGVFDIN